METVGLDHSNGAVLNRPYPLYPNHQIPKYISPDKDQQKYLDILNASHPVDPVVTEGTKTNHFSEGIKHDSGKPRMSLLDSSWLLGVAEVLTFGEKKYAAHNWRKGLSVSRLMDAAARHQASFNDGEDTDPESGKSHLYHASCCLMFASWMIKHRPDLDDRYNG